MSDSPKSGHQSDFSLWDELPRDYLLEHRRCWARDQPQRCMVCLTTEFNRSIVDPQIHEIERRSHGHQLRWARPWNYLLVCHVCHEGPLATMPHAQQLAYKLRRDPEHFDLDRWLRVRDPQLQAPQRVTMEEIRQHAESID